MEYLKHVIGSSGELYKIDLLDQASTGYKQLRATIGLQKLTETVAFCRLLSHPKQLNNKSDQEPVNNSFFEA
ncbi:hypothetical protein [Peribacillus frigoritolerans]|uniref:hypothetical protein n=1 Tax=Peribacillus frigoritolerans TaxID=450367 RepID=UPI002B052F96|nr:hypothetical protein [Peribacillus frigoritolerans]MEA3573909.1 hypothetical protein [Peribacillus frigoritolerans]